MQIHETAIIDNGAKILLGHLSLPLRAAPCAMLASSRAPSSPALAACTVCCINGFSASAFSVTKIAQSIPASRPSEVQQATDEHGSSGTRLTYSQFVWFVILIGIGKQLASVTKLSFEER